MAPELFNVMIQEIKKMNECKNDIHESTLTK